MRKGGFLFDSSSGTFPIKSRPAKISLGVNGGPKSKEEEEMQFHDRHINRTFYAVFEMVPKGAYYFKGISGIMQFSELWRLFPFFPL